MNVVLLYRHEDGRLIELRSKGSKVELWLLLPHRELLTSKDSVDDAKSALPEGFELDAAAFQPPCPECGKASPMSLVTGMYVCPEEDCHSEF